MALYMHTLDGKPAYYTNSEQICYACWHCHNVKNFFATSLKQIRTEQKASREWRERSGFTDHSDLEGYLTVPDIRGTK